MSLSRVGFVATVALALLEHNWVESGDALSIKVNVRGGRKFPGEVSLINLSTLENTPPEEALRTDAEPAPVGESLNPAKGPSARRALFSAQPRVDLPADFEHSATFDLDLQNGPATLTTDEINELLMKPKEEKPKADAKESKLEQARRAFNTMLARRRFNMTQAALRKAGASTPTALSI